MPSCHTMTKGEVYVCNKCGLAMEVVHQCDDYGKSEDSCACPPCTMVCCGEELAKSA